MTTTLGTRWPGTVMYDQSAEDYHAAPGASASRLKQLKRSPAHMRWAIDNPQKPTQAMIVGSATHSAILEPDLFVKEWGRIPEGDGRSKAVKEAKAALIVQHGADHILKPDVYDNILAMRDSVLGNALSLDLLDGADTETSHYWTENGVDCKARVDAIPPEDSQWGNCIVDIKTTANGSPDEFRRTVGNFSYHIQAAHYLSGVLLDGPPALRMNRFIFIVVERDAPHCVAIYELDEDALELGRQEREFLLGQWASCKAEEAAGGPDAWPGFPVEVQELALPGWAYTQMAPIR